MSSQKEKKKKTSADALEIRIMKKSNRRPVFPHDAKCIWASRCLASGAGAARSVPHLPLLLRQLAA